MARPLTFEEPASHVIRVRVTRHQRAMLEQVARENAVRLTSVIRDAVNEYVADYRETDRVFRGPKPPS